MEKNKEKVNKLNIDKGQLAVRIMAGILAILMLLSVFASCIYFIFE